jgi:lysophospholipase L1-like esterase
MSPSLVAAKLLLGPVLLPQALRVRRTALRLPEAAGARSGVAGEGAVQLRVLVVGDSSAAGVGVADQAQALALPLARRLHERLGGAVAWQLVAKSGVNTQEALGLAGEAAIEAADVLAVVLGVNDATGQTRADRYLAGLEQLRAHVAARTGARWTVFCGLPPMHRFTALPHPLRWYLGRCADLLDTELQAWTARQGHGYLSTRWSLDRALLADDGFHPGPLLYPQWADRLANVILANRRRWESA